MALGMMNLPKAPADITPAKFFDEWLPKQLSAVKDMIGSLGGGVSATIGARITGAGGGDWTMVLDGGAVKVEKGLRSDAVVTMIMEAGHFVQAVSGQMDDVMQPPSTSNLTPEQAASKARNDLEAMKTIFGTVKFALTDAVKPFSGMVKFAGELKDDPDVTVTMERATALAIAKGDTNPQAAFMSGQVQIEGDLSILMQLSPILMG